MSPDLGRELRRHSASLAASGLRTARRNALLLGSVALVFYVLTLSPSLVWGDGGRLQTDAMTGGSLYWHFDELASTPTDGWLFDRLGIAAWDHPLWVMAGYALVALPIGEPTYLLNLFTAFAAASAAAILFLVALSLTRSTWGAVLAVASLAVAHTYWFHAVTAEVYSLHALFMALLLWLTIVWIRQPKPSTLVYLALTAGLGLANHLMLILTIGPIVVFVVSTAPRRATLRAQLSGKVLSLALLAFIVGMAPWWIQFLRMVDIAGLSTTVSISAGFPWLGERWPGAITMIPGNIATYLGYLLYQFTPIGTVIGVYGMIRLGRDHHPYASLLFAVFGLHVAFSANYGVADQYAFHLPSYVLFSLFVAAGLATLVSRWRRDGGPLPGRMTVVALVVVALPVLLYAAVPRLLDNAGIEDSDAGIPVIGTDHRDGISYYLNPNQRNETSAERFGQNALETLPSDALVLTAWPMDLESYIAMRHYQLTEELRLDVTLELMLFTGLPLHESALAIANSQQGCRPLYLASLDPEAYPLEELATDFHIEADTYLYRLEPRNSVMGSCQSYGLATATINDLVESVRR